MPFKIKQNGGGFKVTSPNHPKGFAKKPQTKAKAKAQQAALYANADPSETGRSMASMIKS